LILNLVVDKFDRLARNTQIPGHILRWHQYKDPQIEEEQTVLLLYVELKKDLACLLIIQIQYSVGVPPEMMQAHTVLQRILKFTSVQKFKSSVIQSKIKENKRQKKHKILWITMDHIYSATCYLKARIWIESLFPVSKTEPKIPV
jgi:hypothetical protein